MADLERIRWPEGKDFAFTVFDDTDLVTLANTKPVYEFCLGLGMKFTKSVWPLRGAAVPRVGGLTCEDQEYLAWTRQLQSAGVEIGYHLATYHTSTRRESEHGLERFRELYGTYPLSMANHTGCDECIYWGSARLSGINRTVYNLLTRRRRHGRYFGHVPDHPLFWGDLCKARIKYVRNFVTGEINTLKFCPSMPYHDPDRPFVNYWFSASEGPEVKAFVRCISERNQDRLEAEGGACIMYTHFACGFVADGKLHPRFEGLMTRLARKNGWFVPVATLLDYLLEQRGHRDLARPERSQLERRWLGTKLFTGTS